MCKKIQQKIKGAHCQCARPFNKNFRLNTLDKKFVINSPLKVKHTKQRAKDD